MVSYELLIIGWVTLFVLGVIAYFFLLSEMRANREEWRSDNRTDRKERRAELQAEWRERRELSWADGRVRTVYRPGYRSSLWGPAALMPGNQESKIAESLGLGDIFNGDEPR